MTTLSILLLLPFLFHLTSSSTFTITNQCTYTLWAASIPGGGQRLDPHQSWTLNIPPGTAGSRIWARTNCSFDSTGHGNCSTGDCGGLLQCKGYGTSPNTLAEFTFDQFNHQDFFDISLVDGFNVPMDFGPTDAGCRRTRCAGDINGMCPSELRVHGGCDSPCNVFKRGEYCCTSETTCGPNKYSNFFKSYCPDASPYAPNESTSTLTCPYGSNYTVVFCP